MAKLNWQISRPEYGPQFEVVANTRSQAIGKAEAEWLANTAWEADLVGKVCEDGTVFARSKIPEFIATKITNAH